MVVSSTATADDAAPRVVEDCRGVLQVLSDGTIVRSAAGAVDVPVDPSVEWKDVVYDAALGLGLRVYKPPASSAAAFADGDAGSKLPVVVAFHGGGFCINSYATPHFHAACSAVTSVAA
ncbi:putative carboxylesterase 15 [Panicum miliaceum]|uniref:Carboxylesterase 15 n=1 Tax=Panicum miliaceum TaxID=4540 RepID=A0A3L6PQG0_PANMI|nr:putative carboxylesterase 15 [Panicum miliaceum]